MSATVPLDTRGNAEILVLAPLSLEARAVRSGAPWAHVHRIGMGPKRAGDMAPVYVILRLTRHFPHWNLLRLRDGPCGHAGFGPPRFAWHLRRRPMPQESFTGALA